MRMAREPRRSAYIILYSPARKLIRLIPGTRFSDVFLFTFGINFRRERQQQHST